MGIFKLRLKVIILTDMVATEQILSLVVTFDKREETVCENKYKTSFQNIMLAHATR